METRGEREAEEHEFEMYVEPMPEDISLFNRFALLLNLLKNKFLNRFLFENDEESKLKLVCFEYKGLVLLGILRSFDCRLKIFTRPVDCCSSYFLTSNRSLLELVSPKPDDAVSGST